MQLALNLAQRNTSVLLSMTRPNKDFFRRQRALLRHAVPASLDADSSLDEHLLTHHNTTFFMRMAGDSMSGAGIYNGDLLVVDRASAVTHGSIVIAILDGEFTVRRWLESGSTVILRAAHPDHADRHPGADFTLWGVVKWNVHRH